MLSVVAHQGGTGPHVDLWSHWGTQPTVLVGLCLAAWWYHRGRRRRQWAGRWRAQSFWLSVVAIAVALVTPLDALAGDLASAHMVQHVLLVVVAAPLLAFSTPAVTILAGAPHVVRSPLRRARRLARGAPLIRAIRRPAVAWFLHASTLWFWHASMPYGAALDHDAVHAVEHVSFLATAALFWSSVLAVRGPWRASEGYGALLVFTMAMQSVFLAALLTFATTPWYDGYSATTAAWGLDPLADQQLAGAIMWVPAGLVYVGVGVALVARWVRGNGDGSTCGACADWSAGDTVAPTWCPHRSTAMRGSTRPT